MPPKQHELIRLLWPVAVTLPIIAIAASAGRAQPKSFDGAYKGSLECEQLTAGIGVFRTPLSIIVRNGRVMALVPAFDIDGKHELSPAMTAGTIDLDGVFRVGYTLYTRDASIGGDYSVTLNAAGGTLTGTQVLTREITGDGGTRTCKGTVVQVELPRP
jgi:hypothetical protein